jgi:long-chain acyl-CoA synthetase
VTSNAVGETAKPLSIGLPLPGVDVRVVDEAERDAEDDPGEILVRGPNVFPGYWRKEQESAGVLSDGWLRTGDVAYRDEDGYLFLVDRKKDLIIVSGFNVYPKEVEEALVRVPGVDEAVVVGVPDARTGESIRAYVVARAGTSITSQAVIEEVGRYIARFKVPREVQIVGELPRHPTGKVLRRALRGEELLGGESAPV